MTTAAPAKKTRQMPKGGRKGGSVFPRVALSDAITYARKLVSKTHSAPQPKDVILSGVIGAKGGTGEVRMSALKQYGFLKGDAKRSFSADDLAKKISAAPSEELVALYRQAILRPTIFKKLFDTFHGDTVSKAKLKQRAADLKVHPDETATCVDLYVAGMTTAALVAVDGDQIKHLASSNVSQSFATSADADADPEAADERVVGDGSNGDEGSAGIDLSTPASGSTDEVKAAKPSLPNGSGSSAPRAVFNVNVTLDSSLDTEKLQKQLELLKRFGAI